MNTTPINENFERVFLDANDVAKLLYVSKSTAYREIRKLNELLKAQGYLVVSGRVPRRFFEEKYYVS